MSSIQPESMHRQKIFVSTMHLVCIDLNDLAPYTLDILQNSSSDALLVASAAMTLLVRGHKRSWDGAPHMNASTATQMVDYRIRKTSISMTSPIDGKSTRSFSAIAFCDIPVLMKMLLELYKHYKFTISCDLSIL